MIEKFSELTNVPVVLNTSFNLREPIVETPEDAISCYLRSQMDVVVVGNFYSSREESRMPARSHTERSPATCDTML